VSCLTDLPLRRAVQPVLRDGCEGPRLGVRHGGPRKSRSVRDRTASALTWRIG
jgi:hypothetical protein